MIFYDWIDVSSGNFVRMYILLIFIYLWDVKIIQNIRINWFRVEIN